MHRIKNAGDQALKELTLQFDKINLTELEVSKKEVEDAEKKLSAELKFAIQVAAKNIETFHNAQRRDTISVETMPGVTCWRKAVPINKVGIYIPGGSAPLFSTVLAIVAPLLWLACA